MTFIHKHSQRFRVFNFTCMLFFFKERCHPQKATLVNPSFTKPHSSTWWRRDDIDLLCKHLGVSPNNRSQSNNNCFTFSLSIPSESLLFFQLHRWKPSPPSWPCANHSPGYLFAQPLDTMVIQGKDFSQVAFLFLDPEIRRGCEKHVKVSILWASFWSNYSDLTRPHPKW